MSTVAMICVDDVEATSKLLHELFTWTNAHGGSAFGEMIDGKGRAVLWLHDLDEHGHDRFTGVRRGTKGRGVNIYVVREDLAEVYKRVKKAKLKIVEPMHMNENAHLDEFTFELADGYLFTCCDRGDWLRF